MTAKTGNCLIRANKLDEHDAQLKAQEDRGITGKIFQAELVALDGPANDMNHHGEEKLASDTTNLRLEVAQDKVIIEG